MMRGSLLGPALLKELARLARKVDGMRGDGVINTPEAIVIQRQGQRRKGGGSGELFPVSLEQDGGADGTDSTAPTYTYEATRNGKVIGSTLSPQQQRPNGAVVPAAIGMCCYVDGELTLWWCDEIPETATCP